ncbi:MAG: hypothetical protein AAB834_03565 [Patescibacteria group bacterium]
MKTNTNQHPLSVHQRTEEFFRHRAILTLVLAFMALGLVKYESHLLGIVQQVYAEGFGLVNVYTHHEETTRMPVNFGSNVRTTDISGQ